MILLAIESTCDETAAALVDDHLQVLGSVVASQDALHADFGGVVPEIAARAHLEQLLPVVHTALRRAGVQLSDVDAVAVTNSPGLAGSLLVGLAAAKALAFALDVPLLGVNHLHAHLYACRIAYGPDVFPAVGLIASGGHTSLFHCQPEGKFDLLGGTIDDAAGEAFDKVATLLELGFPGGPAVQRAAQTGSPDAFRFPRSFVDDPQRLEFSFSGLKTAVRYQVIPPGATTPPKPLTSAARSDLAASFQEAVVDVLVAKSLHALEQIGLDTLCVGGGVAANSRLRERLAQTAAERGFRLHIAPHELCTDNAVMAALAFERIKVGSYDALDLDAFGGLVR